MPLLGAVWAASDENGKDAFLIDSIYARSKLQDRGEGYGTWIIDVTDKNVSVSTGLQVATSSYGARNHVDILGLGDKTKNKVRTENVFFKVVSMR